MIALNLNVKESAYEKIIYFLTHLKDDVVILNRENLAKKAKHSNNHDYFFNTLRNRALKVEKSVNIDDMMNNSLTYDSDFKKLQKHTEIDIEILT